MDEAQADRLLGLGFDVVARYDVQGRKVAGWLRDGLWSGASSQWAADAAAQRAQWGLGLGGQIARQVVKDELAGLLTVLVPVPGGGFVVAAVERQLIDSAANGLADKLEAAVQREFGPSWAPWVAAAIGGGALLLVTAAARRGS